MIGVLDGQEGLGNRFAKHHGKTSKQTDEWYTPPEIFDALKMDFDLDPCSPMDGPVPWIPAKKFYTARENGLAQNFEGKVWLNPPYGPETGRWLKKLAYHNNGMALLFARTDTKWFHESGTSAGAICFVAGRPHFFTATRQRAPHNSGAPIMLLAYGEEAVYSLMSCKLGHVMSPTPDFRQALGAIPLQPGMPTAAEAIRKARDEA